MNVEINLSMKGSSGMVNIMVKELTLILMETSILGIGRISVSSFTMIFTIPELPFILKFISTFITTS
jgi:hypothetical protein